MDNNKVSFCFTHYNRLNLHLANESLPLFKNCLSTLKNCLTTLPELNYEIVISSYDDSIIYNKLTEFVYHLFDNSKVIITRYPTKDFTRGGGRQSAYKTSTGDIIAFIDADMLFLRSQVITNGIKVCKTGGAYFPVCYSFYNNGSGDWRPTGKGNCFIPKNLLQDVTWLAKKEWGKEDDKFMDEINHKTDVYRGNCPGFYHQWHPGDSNSSSPFK